MVTAKEFNKIFDLTVELYHRTDDVNAKLRNPYAEGTLEHVLAEKCWIDAVQWHLEDIIRDPGIDPTKALGIKRRIDRLNQQRTDMVERIDDFFLKQFAGVKPQAGATINTESPAWAIDRLSILALKIYHMREQTQRADATAAHIALCQGKLAVLLEQRNDLTLAIDQLLADIAAGRKYMKVYRQMKMYNDPSTNPILYGKQQHQ